MAKLLDKDWIDLRELAAEAERLGTEVLDEPAICRETYYGILQGSSPLERMKFLLEYRRKR